MVEAYGSCRVSNLANKNNQTHIKNYNQGLGEKVFQKEIDSLEWRLEDD